MSVMVHQEKPVFFPFNCSRITLHTQLINGLHMRRTFFCKVSGSVAGFVVTVQCLSRCTVLHTQMSRAHASSLIKLWISIRFVYSHLASSGPQGPLDSIDSHTGLS